MPKRRPLTVTSAVAVLGLLAFWLLRASVAPLDMGPAVALVARPGVGFVLARDRSGRWRGVSTLADDARAAAIGLDGVRGLPALAADGRVVALGPDGLLEVDDGAPRAGPPLPDGVDPGEVELLGLASDGRPVLRVHTPAGARLDVLVDSGWRTLADEHGAARPEDEGMVVLCPAGRTALAFRGDDGWEAWTWDASLGSARRAIARECRRERAVFVPSGESLVVDGKAAGLYALALDDDRLTFMTDGNLGDDARLPWSTGFRTVDATMLVHPEYDLHSFLQIYQTHLSGGGRYQFTTGHMHHYLSAVSPGGRYLVYAQSELEPDAAGALHEELYLFDFDRAGSPAVSLGERLGGVPDQGPVWAGDERSPVLFWVADGRLWRVDRGEPTDPSPES
ncbi:MAG: hypothetical protein H6825_05410 [Planctomycetes bacterium]|nr:hypothetical protein [Planctomycetota bacterium]